MPSPRFQVISDPSRVRHFIRGAGFPTCSRTLSLPFPNLNDPLGYYRLLGLPTTADARQIREAGRRKLRQYHPDGATPDGKKFPPLLRAYRVLSSPGDKWRYDNTPPGARHIDKHTTASEVRGMTPLQQQKHFSFWTEGTSDEDMDLADEWYRQLCRVGWELGDRGVVRIVLTWNDIGFRGRNIHVPRVFPSTHDALRVMVMSRDRHDGDGIHTR